MDARRGATSKLLNRAPDIESLIGTRVGSIEEAVELVTRCGQTSEPSFAGRAGWSGLRNDGTFAIFCSEQHSKGCVWRAEFEVEIRGEDDEPTLWRLDKITGEHDHIAQTRLGYEDLSDEEEMVNSEERGKAWRTTVDLGKSPRRSTRSRPTEQLASQQMINSHGKNKRRRLNADSSTLSAKRVQRESPEAHTVPTRASYDSLEEFERTSQDGQNQMMKPSTDEPASLRLPEAPSPSLLRSPPPKPRIKLSRSASPNLLTPATAVTQASEPSAPSTELGDWLASLNPLLRRWLPKLQALGIHSVEIIRMYDRTVFDELLSDSSQPCTLKPDEPFLVPLIKSLVLPHVGTLS